jgi:hypothetical protein
MSCRSVVRLCHACLARRLRCAGVSGVHWITGRDAIQLRSHAGHGSSHEAHHRARPFGRASHRSGRECCRGSRPHFRRGICFAHGRRAIYDTDLAASRRQRAHAGYSLRLQQHGQRWTARHWLGIERLLGHRTLQPHDCAGWSCEWARACSLRWLLPRRQQAAAHLGNLRSRRLALSHRARELRADCGRRYRWWRSGLMGGAAEEWPDLRVWCDHRLAHRDRGFEYAAALGCQQDLGSRRQLHRVHLRGGHGERQLSPGRSPLRRQQRCRYDRHTEDCLHLRDWNASRSHLRVSLREHIEHHRHHHGVQAAEQGRCRIHSDRRGDENLQSCL